MTRAKVSRTSSDKLFVGGGAVGGWQFDERTKCLLIRDAPFSAPLAHCIKEQRHEPSPLPYPYRTFAQLCYTCARQPHL